MFKDRLREARKAKNLTQEKLAEQIGVKKSTVAGYETGYSEPDMEKLIKIMRVLDVDANYLCQDEMEESKKPEGLSDRALAVARAYDSLTDYGKEVIDSVIKIDGKQKGFFFKGVPHISELKLDGTVEAKVAAMRELKELQTEEVKTEE